MAELAQNVNDIQFPEFTAKLIDGVFKTLVASQVEQVQAYVELVKETSKALSVYINDTIDDISGEEIMSFVTKYLPTKPVPLPEGNISLTEDEVKSYKKATDVSGYDSGIVITQSTAKADLLKVAAARLAANKYTILKQMLEMGLIRLVIKESEVETKLQFSTFSYNHSDSSISNFSNKSKGFNVNAGFFGGVFGVAASAKYNSTSVSTNSSSSSSTDTTSLKIGGRVYIKFKSDYKPLGTAK